MAKTPRKKNMSKANFFFALVVTFGVCLWLFLAFLAGMDDLEDMEP